MSDCEASWHVGSRLANGRWRYGSFVSDRLGFDFEFGCVGNL